MSLSFSIASDSRTSRRLRRCAPLLVVLALMALALVPGMISGDRPFQISLCGDGQESLATCVTAAASVAQKG